MSCKDIHTGKHLCIHKNNFYFYFFLKAAFRVGLIEYEGLEKVFTFLEAMVLHPYIIASVGA